MRSRRSGPLPRGAERVTIAERRQGLAHGIHVPPTVRSSGPRTLILGFAGNAWNAPGRRRLPPPVYPAEDMVAFHYRGYASTGSPSAEALIEDLPLIYDLRSRSAPPKQPSPGFQHWQRDRAARG